jgi:sugar O-acyltransferase (sialic acid O-acetyltransferase NeuD family)
MIDVCILGAGGHGRDVRSIINDSADYNFVGFYDDDVSKDTLGTIDDFIKTTNLAYVIGVNSSTVRQAIDRRIPSNFLAATVVHPSAYVGDDCQIAEGVVIAAGVVITTEVSIGRHSHINVNATVSQNSFIDAFVTISPGSNVCGDCVIGSNTMLGAGSTVINLMRVGNNVIIGAGATVISNIPSDSKAVGTPARLL